MVCLPLFLLDLYTVYRSDRQGSRLSVLHVSVGIVAWDSRALVPASSSPHYRNQWDSWT